MNFNKRKLIYITTAAVIVASSLLAFFAYQRNRFTFTIPSNIDHISIPDIAETIRNGDTVRIANGEYLYTGHRGDDEYEETPLVIDGGTPKTITIPDNLPLSPMSLLRLSDSERPSIVSVIDSYIKDNEIGQYHDDHGGLLELDYQTFTVSVLSQGQYAAAIIAPKGTSINDPVGLYRLVLTKDGSTWSIASSPAILLTNYNTKNIPLDILIAANSLTL